MSTKSTCLPTAVSSREDPLRPCRPLFEALEPRLLLSGATEGAGLQTVVALGIGYDGVLWEVDTATGAASNPRATGVDHPVGIAAGRSGALYALTASDSASPADAVYLIDPTTGTATRVGPTGLSNIREGDVDVDPTSGVLYGLQRAPAGARVLFRMHPATGAAAVVGSIAAAGDLSAMAFDDAGQLWVLDTGGERLLKVDKATAGVMASVPLSAALGSAAGMDFEPATGELYVVDGGVEGTDALYTLATATGQLTPISQTGLADGLVGLEFVEKPHGMVVSGYKWNDLDGNGDWDAGEPPMPGCTVYVDLNGDLELDDGEPRAVSDATGFYLIALEGHQTGPHVVAEVPETGWAPTYDPQGSPHRPFEVLFRDTLFGIEHDAGDLYRIDPETAEVEEIGSTGISDFNSLAFAPDRTLYGLRYVGWPDYEEELYTINTVTATATLVGSLGSEGESASGLAISNSGVAYAADREATVLELIEIDLSTGDASYVLELEDSLYNKFHAMEWRSDGYMLGLDYGRGYITWLNPSNGHWGELQEFGTHTGDVAGMTIVDESGSDQVGYLSKSDELWWFKPLQFYKVEPEEIGEFSSPTPEISGLAWRAGLRRSLFCGKIREWQGVDQIIANVNFGNRRDNQPPKVADVRVRGTGWSQGFLDFLAAEGLGEGGYSIPVGSAAQLDELPWVNVDQIEIAFTEPVAVGQEHLAVRGVNVPSYLVRAFTYDTSTDTARWTLAEPVRADKLLLVLSDEVTDAAGNALDGEWTDAVSQYTSGDGSAGGDFRFRLNTLPGDVDGSGEVRSSDVIKIRRKVNNEAGDPGYSCFYDVDGSGEIRSSDVIKLRRNTNTALPPGQPVLPPGAPPAARQTPYDELIAAALKADRRRAGRDPLTPPRLDALWLADIVPAAI